LPALIFLKSFHYYHLFKVPLRSGYISDNNIPSIKTSEWTTINLTVIDGYGIKWSFLLEKMPIYARYIWPIIHPSWRDLLGYSALRFEPEIIDGDPRGWYTKITPSSIANADNGKLIP
jgi:hypothetical protein